MSRIGKKPIPVPDGAKVSIADRAITVEGKLGKLTYTHRPEIQVKVDADKKQVVCTRSAEERTVRAYHGLTRALLNNMLIGVTQGYEKKLEIQGVGYRAAKQGNNLSLQVGFSRPVDVAPPNGIEFELENPTTIHIHGIDKELVGQVAADLRKVRPPEPYKGKGIRYRGEYVRRKAGKGAR